MTLLDWLKQSTGHADGGFGGGGNNDEYDYSDDGEPPSNLYGDPPKKKRKRKAPKLKLKISRPLGLVGYLETVNEMFDIETVEWPVRFFFSFACFNVAAIVGPTFLLPPFFF